MRQMENFLKRRIKTQIKGQGDPTAGPCMLLACAWPKRLINLFRGSSLLYSFFIEIFQINQFHNGLNYKMYPESKFKFSNELNNAMLNMQKT